MECPSLGVRTYENGVSKICCDCLGCDLRIAGLSSDPLPAKVPRRPGAIRFGSSGPGLYADRSASPAAVSEKEWPLRDLAERPGTHRVVYPPHGQSRTGRLHR